MHLIEPQRRVRPTPPPLDLVMTEADCDPEIASSPEVASVDVTAERLPEIVLDSETANSLSDLEAEDGV